MARKAKRKAGRKVDHVRNARKWLKKGNNAVIAVVGVVVVLSLIFVLSSGGGEDSSTVATVPQTAPTTPITIDREMDNMIRFGWNHRGEYDAHNFVCTTCCCDESRKDYVYVSVGYIEFDLKTTLNASYHELVVTTGNLNENCRRNNVLLDGVLVGDMNKPTGSSQQAEWKFNVTPAGEVVHVRIEHMGGTPEDCWWGNDVFGARIYARK